MGDVSLTGQTANRHGQEVLGCRGKASRASLGRGVKTRGEEKEEEEYECQGDHEEEEEVEGGQDGGCDAGRKQRLVKSEGQR